MILKNLIKHNCELLDAVIFLLINYLPKFLLFIVYQFWIVSGVINFCFKIAFNKKEEIVDVQTIGNGKREEITLSTWINVPLDVSISFRYLFSDARTEQF